VIRNKGVGLTQDAVSLQEENTEYIELGILAGLAEATHGEDISHIATKAIDKQRPIAKFYYEKAR